MCVCVCVCVCVSVCVCVCVAVQRFKWFNKTPIYKSINILILYID